MFSMDDFEKGNEFYDKLPSNLKDSDNFVSTLMMVTHHYKNVNYDNISKSGDVLMMKLFNMTGLQFIESNEDAFDVILAMIAHTLAMLCNIENKDEYFDFFDETIVVPLIGDK